MKKTSIEIWENLLYSLEKLDAKGLVTKTEKFNIQKRIRKQLDEVGIKAVHSGFRQWKCVEI